MKNKWKLVAMENLAGLKAFKLFGFQGNIIRKSSTKKAHEKREKSTRKIIFYLGCSLVTLRLLNLEGFSSLASWWNEKKLYFVNIVVVVVDDDE